MEKKKNLAGYARDGKRFIPPMKQLAGLREYSYVNDMLPELIWLGLIHDRCGYRFGARVLQTAIKAIGTEARDSKYVNFALQSTYAAMTAEHKELITEAWKKNDLYDDIRCALSPLVVLFDGFALSFVGQPPDVFETEQLVDTLKKCVGNHLSKYETPGIVLNGSLLLTRLLAGTITFSADIEIPDFNAVIDRPDSEEAKRAAGFMRANALGEIGMLNLSNSWPKYFWNRNAEISPCEPLDDSPSDE